MTAYFEARRASVTCDSPAAFRSARSSAPVTGDGRQNVDPGASSVTRWERCNRNRPHPRPRCSSAAWAGAVGNDLHVRLPVHVGAMFTHPVTKDAAPTIPRAKRPCFTPPPASFSTMNCGSRVAVAPIRIVNALGAAQQSLVPAKSAAGRTFGGGGRGNLGYRHRKPTREVSFFINRDIQASPSVRRLAGPAVVAGEATVLGCRPALDHGRSDVPAVCEKALPDRPAVLVGVALPAG